MISAEKYIVNGFISVKQKLKNNFCLKTYLSRLTQYCNYNIQAAFSSHIHIEINTSKSTNIKKSTNTSREVKPVESNRKLIMKNDLI